MSSNMLQFVFIAGGDVLGGEGVWEEETSGTVWKRPVRVRLSPGRSPAVGPLLNRLSSSALNYSSTRETL